MFFVQFLPPLLSRSLSSYLTLFHLPSPPLEGLRRDSRSSTNWNGGQFVFSHIILGIGPACLSIASGNLLMPTFSTLMISPRVICMHVLLSPCGASSAGTSATGKSSTAVTQKVIDAEAALGLSVKHIYRKSLFVYRAQMLVGCPHAARRKPRTCAGR